MKTFQPNAFLNTYSVRFFPFIAAHVAQYVESLSLVAVSITKWEISELSSLNILWSPLWHQSAFPVYITHLAGQSARKPVLNALCSKHMWRRFLTVSIGHAGLKALSCIAWKLTDCHFISLVQHNFLCDNQSINIYQNNGVFTEIIGGNFSICEFLKTQHLITA